MTSMQLTVLAMLVVIALQWVIVVALLGIRCRHHTPVRMVSLPTAKVRRGWKRGEYIADKANRYRDDSWQRAKDSWKAIEGDWQRVSNDMRKVIGTEHDQ